MAMDYYTCVSHPSHPISLTDTLQWRSCVFLPFSLEIVRLNNCLDIAVAWIAQAVFDMIIFGLTVYRTLQTRRFRDGRGLLLSGSGLVDLVWRDGAMYFVVMATHLWRSCTRLPRMTPRLAPCRGCMRMKDAGRGPSPHICVRNMRKKQRDAP